jgi:hypothetical protein
MYFDRKASKKAIATIPPAVAHLIHVTSDFKNEKKSVIVKSFSKRKNVSGWKAFFL